MRVLYVSQYFVNADQPGGVRHWQHTQALAKAGHRVQVVTSFVQHKEREVPEAYRGKRIVREYQDGVEVWRTYATPGYGRDLRSRLANYVTFAFWAGVAALRAGKADVIVASSPSLPASFVAAIVSRLRRTRFVFEVRDLWPESAVAMGLVRNRKLLTLARWMSRFCERRADRVIALTEGIRDGLIANGVPASRITLITNGVDLDVTPPLDVEVALPEAAFVAMYVGAHGTYSSLDTVLDAAALLRGRTEVCVVLVGGGDQRDRLMARASELGLSNVRFVGAVPKREVTAWLARADCCLLPYQDIPLFAGALPNKVFDYLGASRPIIAAAPPGELTRLVERVGCGLAIAPENAGAMAAAIERLAADRDAGRAMGAAGRAHALATYDRARLAERFVEVVTGKA